MARRVINSPQCGELPAVSYYQTGFRRVGLPRSLESIVVLTCFSYTFGFRNSDPLMFYGNTIQDTRQMFFTSWEKYQQKKQLAPLENELVQVIIAHPEYHKILENQNKFQQHSYYPEFGETNPFLHMGLHLAVREQVATDRPAGIRRLYKNLVKKYHDVLIVEHLIMDQLAECLWLSQKNNLPPNEYHYLQVLASL